MKSPCFFCAAIAALFFFVLPTGPLSAEELNEFDLAASDSLIASETVATGSPESVEDSAPYVGPSVILYQSYFRESRNYLAWSADVGADGVCAAAISRATSSLADLSMVPGKTVISPNAVEPADREDFFDYEAKIDGLAVGLEYFYRVFCFRRDGSAQASSGLESFVFQDYYSDSARRLLESAEPFVVASTMAGVPRDSMTEEDVSSFVTETMAGLSSDSQVAAFIAYGLDRDTARLGRRERADVANSFYAAYRRWPLDTNDYADLLRMANGRWPLRRSGPAEQRARELFRQAYSRVPDGQDANDNAAVKTIAYGLRQRLANRSIPKERVGMGLYLRAFGRLPDSSSDWNVMQALSYSGVVKRIDTDRDYLPDYMEKRYKTNAKKADTDGDGIMDGIEVERGLDPLKSSKKMVLGVKVPAKLVRPK